MSGGPTTPHEYLAALADDWRRETLNELRQVLAEEGADLEEGIGYGMLSYELAGRAVFHLHAQKAYVSLYVGDAAKVDPTGALLAGLDVGKGCIRFKRSNRVAETGVRPFIVETLRKARAGRDIDC